MHLFDEDVASSTHAPAKESEHGAERHRADGATPPQSPAGLLNLQRSVGNAGVVQLLREGDEDPHGLSMLGSGGSPLDSQTKVQMESAIGADFSDVRIHTGGDADQSAKSFGAHAYTAGSDVVFAEGRYDPGSTAGQKTLAHELTHVVQQRSGPVDGTVTDSGVKVSDPSDQFEQAAEANAERVVGGGPSEAAAAPSSAPAGVQREEEDEVQGLFVQREDDGEMEEPVQGSFEDASVQREEEQEEEPG